MNVQELEGAELDCLVARAEGWTFFRNKRGGITINQPGIAESTEVGNYRAKFDGNTGMPVAPITEVEAFSEIGAFFPSSDWSQGGPIIERERIEVSPCSPVNWGNEEYRWMALAYLPEPHVSAHGPTPLIAAMRAYVASKEPA